MHLISRLNLYTCFYLFDFVFMVSSFTYLLLFFVVFFLFCFLLLDEVKLYRLETFVLCLLKVLCIRIAYLQMKYWKEGN